MNKEFQIVKPPKSDDVFISIKLEGEKITETDIVEVANFLILFEDLIQDFNCSLNGKNSKVKLYIKDIKQGSIEIFLSSIQEVSVEILKQGYSGLLNAANLYEDIGKIGNFLLTIFNTVLLLRTLKPNIADNQDGTYELIGKDKSKKIKDVKIIKLITSKPIRKSISKLASKAFDDIEASKVTIRNHQKNACIEAKDRNIFIYDDEDEPDEKRINNVRLEIVTLSFKQSNMWKFKALTHKEYIGNREFNARVEDQSFWTKVHNKEIVFKEGDVIRCNLTIFSSIDSPKIFHVTKIVKKEDVKIYRQTKIK